MEIMSIDVIIYLISLILASIILAFYTLSPKVSELDGDADKGFAVIDIIKALKKACPVQLSNKWRLLPLNWGPTRCWSKSIVFPGFKNLVKLYGATCAVTCSSMYAFSLISDISKWGEWEPSQSQSLLKAFDKNEFKRDNFMQADQIAGIQRGTNVQSYVAMYRFLSFPSKCTKWILFWDAKKFDFMFFIIQPAASRSIETQCVITHLYGSTQLSTHSASLIAQRLSNIKEFLSLSLLNIRPVGYSATLPPLPSPSSTPQRAPTEEENPQSVFLESSNCDTSNTMFVLVPFFQCVKFTLKRLKGYNLVLKKREEEPQPKKPKRKLHPLATAQSSDAIHVKHRKQKNDSTTCKEDLHLEQPKRAKPPEPLRRAMSDFSISTKFYRNLDGSLNLSPIAIDNPVTPFIIIDEPPKADVVSEGVEVDEQKELKEQKEDSRLQPSPPSQGKTRRFSDPAVQNSVKHKSSSVSECSEAPSEDENHKSLHSISELEESTVISDHDKNELFCSSTSDYELVETNQQFIDTRIASYLTQGNYGASVLQTEMMLASQFDRTLNSGNRVAGGWIHYSTVRGIPVLTKSISGKFMKIVSFLCQIEIPVNYKDVWKCVKNPRFRFISDESVKTVQIIDRISESQKLIHIYHETSGLIRKEAVDFCLLQTEREEKNNFYSVFQSIEYERCPFMTSVVRGSLKPSGWIVQNISPKNSKVTYLVQILVYSPDSIYIQDLSSMVPQSLLNLKHYITSRPK